jgi:hypothetical protein
LACWSTGMLLQWWLCCAAIGFNLIRWWQEESEREAAQLVKSSGGCCSVLAWEKDKRAAAAWSNASESWTRKRQRRTPASKLLGSWPSAFASRPRAPTLAPATPDACGCRHLPRPAKCAWSSSRSILRMVATSRPGPTLPWRRRPPATCACGRRLWRRTRGRPIDEVVLLALGLHELLDADVEPAGRQHRHLLLAAAAT